MSDTDKPAFERGLLAKKNNSILVGTFFNVNRMSGMMFILLNMSNIGFLESEIEPEVGDYLYYLPHLYKVKTVVRRWVYRICGVKIRFKTILAQDELYPTTLTQRPPITTQECSRMKVRLQNCKKLGVACLQLQEQLESVQQENGMLQGQVVELKQQLIVAEQLREHFRARTEANNSLVELECQLKQTRLDCESAGTESDALSVELKSALRKLVEYEGIWKQLAKKFRKRFEVRKLELKIEAEITPKCSLQDDYMRLRKSYPVQDHCQYKICFGSHPLQRLRKSNGDSNKCLY